jgi:hypothetical protein
MEELLKIAKEKYPVGCKIIPLNLAYMDKGTEFQVIDSWENIGYTSETEVWVNTGQFNSQIYWDGKWAEIISTPEVEETKKDNINPSHYRNGRVECIDALESATVNKTGIEAVCTANVIKYLWRYEDKNGLEDVKKAQWYLEKLIKHLENVK